MTNDETKAAIVALVDAMYPALDGVSANVRWYPSGVAEVSTHIGTVAIADAIAPNDLAALHAATEAHARIAAALTDDPCQLAPLSPSESDRLQGLRATMLFDDAIALVYSERESPWTPR